VSALNLCCLLHIIRQEIVFYIESLNARVVGDNKDLKFQKVETASFNNSIDWLIM